VYDPRMFCSENDDGEQSGDDAPGDIEAAGESIKDGAREAQDAVEHDYVMIKTYNGRSGPVEDANDDDAAPGGKPVSTFSVSSPDFRADDCCRSCTVSSPIERTVSSAPGGGRTLSMAPEPEIKTLVAPAQEIKTETADAYVAPAGGLKLERFSPPRTRTVAREDSVPPEESPCKRVRFQSEPPPDACAA
jgi:hypothetical protein